MARYVFSLPTVAAAGRPARVTFYDRQTAGRRLTDLYEFDGSGNPTDPVTNGVVITDAAGASDDFLGPTDYNRLWYQVNDTGALTQLVAQQQSEASAPATPLLFGFSVPGTVVVTNPDGSEDVPIINGTGSDLEVTGVAVSLGEAPDGDDLELDVLVDDVSVLDTAVTVPDGENGAIVSGLTASWPAGDSLVVRVTQVGSSTAGARMSGYVLARDA